MSLQLRGPLHRHPPSAGQRKAFIWLATKLNLFASAWPRQINLVGLNRRGGRCMGNVGLAWRAGNGRDCLDEAETLTIDHICWVGEGVGSSASCRVGGPRRRGDSSRPALRGGAQPGAGATIRLCGLAPCPSCLGGNGSTGEVLGVHGGRRQVWMPWDELLGSICGSCLRLPAKRET